MKTAAQTGAFQNRAVAVAAAKKAERETGGLRHWVAIWYDGTADVVTRPPLIGEWYDSDGVRHG